MQQPITLVCGFGRCGSSLVMQMQAAGGLPIYQADWPSFETPWVMGLPQDRAWLPQAAGQAVKILDPQLRLAQGGWGLPLRSIWVDRNPDQQAKSMCKFLAAVTPIQTRGDRQTRKRIAASLVKDRPAALSILRSLGPVCITSFERILQNPLAVARLLNDFVGGGLRVDAMAAAVVSRPTACLPGLLEINQLLQAHGGRA